MPSDESTAPTDHHLPTPASTDAPHSMTVSEAGRRGGRTTKGKYGATHFQAIGKKGGDALKASVTLDHYSHLGQQGGKATKAGYGTEFYSQIGKKGGAVLKRQSDPDFYSRIGKLGGSAPRRTRRQASQPDSSVFGTPTDAGIKG